MTHLALYFSEKSRINFLSILSRPKGPAYAIAKCVYPSVCERVYCDKMAKQVKLIFGYPRGPRVPYSVLGGVMVLLTKGELWVRRILLKMAEIGRVPQVSRDSHH